MFKKGFRHVFMDQAGDGQGGGGAAAGGEGGGGEGGAAGAGGEGGAGAGSALAQGAQGQEKQHFIPEKYQVKKEDGSLDIEASARKVSEAHAHLEKRLGSGDVPPKTAEEYAVTVPDALKDKWNPEDDQIFKDFRAEAHAAGMTQKQFDMVMSRYLDLAPKLVGGAQQVSTEECTAELKAEWKTEEQYKAGVGNAWKAATGYFGADADAIISRYGNDAALIRGLAKIGAEMGEDTTPNNGGALPAGQTVETLMSSEAYTNPKHPQHAAVSQQVKAHFDAKAAKDARSGNVPVI